LAWGVSACMLQDSPQYTSVCARVTFSVGDGFLSALVRQCIPAPGQGSAQAGSCSVVEKPSVSMRASRVLSCALYLRCHTSPAAFISKSVRRILSPSTCYCFSVIRSNAALCPSPTLPFDPGQLRRRRARVQQRHQVRAPQHVGGEGEGPGCGHPNPGPEGTGGAAAGACVAGCGQQPLPQACWRVGVRRLSCWCTHVSGWSRASAYVRVWLFLDVCERRICDWFGCPTDKCSSAAFARVP
jgi:hypothetical protein